MATDVDVQFFSHLNGLTLDNNWGDLIRLLDTCLVNGKNLPAITSAEIDEQGNVIVDLFADHKCLLFQIVELSGFDPVSLNQKYRIKGIPNNTQLILKPQNSIVEKNVITKGNAKLAALGYEIVFRDNNHIKRVYRAQNPTEQHPYIRVDESLSDGVNSYDANYAKYAMVGLLEHMDHIDDYQNPDVLQLPFNPSDPVKNWRIAGTGASVVRGWSRWHWARNASGYNGGYDAAPPSNGERYFTLCGDKNAFYLFTTFEPLISSAKQLLGCGVFESAKHADDKNWFMMCPTDQRNANTTIDHTMVIGGWPLMYAENSARFLVATTSIDKKNHEFAIPILPNRQLGSGISSTFEHRSGANELIQNGFFALQIPFMDEKQLRGTLNHIAYAGGTLNLNQTTVFAQDRSMYIYDGSVVNSKGTGGCYFYLGEFE